MSDKNTVVMHERDLAKTSAKQKVGKVAVMVGTYLFLIIVAVCVLFPFYWMINSSLKTLSEYREPVPTFWPKQVMFGNYAEAFTTANLGRLFLNTA